MESESKSKFKPFLSSSSFAVSDASVVIELANGTNERTWFVMELGRNSQFNENRI